MRSLTAEFSVKRVVRFDNDGSVKAYVDLAVGDQILIKGVRVVNGKNGMFVSMPRQQTKKGLWFDVVEVTDDLKLELERIVLDAYQQDR